MVPYELVRQDLEMVRSFVGSTSNVGGENNEPGPGPFKRRRLARSSSTRSIDSEKESEFEFVGTTTSPSGFDVNRQGEERQRTSDVREAARGSIVPGSLTSKNSKKMRQDERTRMFEGMYAYRFDCYETILMKCMLLISVAAVENDIHEWSDEGEQDIKSSSKETSLFDFSSVKRNAKAAVPNQRFRKKKTKKPPPVTVLKRLQSTSSEEWISSNKHAAYDLLDEFSASFNTPAVKPANQMNRKRISPRYETENLLPIINVSKYQSFASSSSSKPGKLALAPTTASNRNLTTLPLTTTLQQRSPGTRRKSDGSTLRTFGRRQRTLPDEDLFFSSMLMNDVIPPLEDGSQRTLSTQST